VRRLDAPRAERDGAHHDPGPRLEQTEGIERGSAADDVGQRVEGPDLVQMEPPEVLAVDRGLGRAEETEDITGEGGDRG